MTSRTFTSVDFLESSIEVSLQQRIVTVMREGGGGPTLWHIIQKTLHGAAMAKMIKAQKIINETKLKDVPGLDVGKYHEMVKPALYTCNKQDKLPLNVGPTVINNHLGPQDVALNATVMKYAGEQAALGMAEEQYIKLLPQMDSLINIYDSAADWEKVEIPRGMYMVGLRLNQQH